LENLCCALRYNIRKIRDTLWFYLIFTLSYLVNSVWSCKRFTATLTETEKLRNDFYIIKTSLVTIFCEYRPEIINYLSSWVITIIVVWKTDGHFDLIEGFINLRKDGKKIGRQKLCQELLMWKIPVKLICHALCNSFCQSVIHYLKSSLGVSAKRDWALSASKFLYSWYRFNFVGKIVWWLALAIQSPLAPKLRKE
jgi:hypothetical protein